MNRKVKLDVFNRKIITILHKQADIANIELADEVGLSPSACFQRTKSLKEAGYLKSFHTELDLDEICENIIAYTEFSLHDNSAPKRRAFEQAIGVRPEFMDCLRITGDYDYISFSCARNITELNKVCDELNSQLSLGIARTNIRIVIERSKWHLGYPLEKLEWKD